MLALDWPCTQAKALGRRRSGGSGTLTAARRRRSSALPVAHDLAALAIVVASIASR
jgi:hypothetical protein